VAYTSKTATSKRSTSGEGQPAVLSREPLRGQLERAVLHKLLVELEATGYLKREKRGRRMHYTVNTEKNLRGECVSDLKVRDLLAVVEGRKSG
jgi:hypothetical protein